jgi:membrane fusion protein (multidrug efflux system)
MLILATGCSQAGAEQKQILEQLQAAAVARGDARVEAVELTPSDAALTLELPGEVTGWKDATLASAPGGLIEDVRVAAGDTVSKGATLVTVDRAVAVARLTEAKASLEQAQDELTRLEALGDLAPEAQLAGLRTRVKVAEADVGMARTQVARTTVTAPFAGKIGQLGVEVGEYAPPGSPLLRLVQTDPVKVTLSVADRDVVALEQGLAARVETPASGTLLSGTVSHVAPVADLSTRSFLVEVEVPNPDGLLLPGMIARVEVSRQLADDVVLLPQEWLVTKLDGYGVFVIEEEVARWRPLELGEVVRGQVVVEKGVTIGDKVVVVGQHDLVDGDPVDIAREGTCCVDGRPTFASN